MRVEEIKEFPDEVFHLNVNGSFRKTIRPNAKMEISQYWSSHSRKIGLVMLASTLLLTGIILYETDVLQFLWGLVILVFGSAFDTFVGVFV